MPNPAANKPNVRIAPLPAAVSEFKGFGEWVEVFAAGTHTDAKGKTRTWTEADLDQMVSNFNEAHPFPLVIGHPKTDSPAFGWGKAVKRAGQKLLAQFSQVPEAVEKAAESGAYRNRSAKIAKTDAGYKLVHVGLLGATPPAIEGLEAVYNAADEGEEFEFSLTTSSVLDQLPWMVRSLARGMRSLREWIVADKGVEQADKALPVWPIEDLERAAAEAEAQRRAAEQPSPFNAPNPEESAVFTQADIDAAVKKARDEEAAKLKPLQEAALAAEFSGRLAANQAFVSGLVSDKDGNVRLTPAQAEGWAEALTFAQGLETAEFTFNAAEGGEQKPQLYEFLKSKLQALAPVLKLGQQLATADSQVNTGDVADLHKAAAEFQASEAEAGRTVSISEAVSHVMATKKAA